jgi:hypothetical protein
LLLLLLLLLACCCGTILFREESDFDDLFRELKQQNKLNLFAPLKGKHWPVMDFNPRDNDLHCTGCMLVMTEAQFQAKVRFDENPSKDAGTRKQLANEALNGVCEGFKTADVVVIGKMDRPAGLVRGTRRFVRKDRRCQF